jgi:hypothetical protein
MTWSSLMLRPGAVIVSMALADIIFSPAFADREADAAAAKTSLIISQASGYGIESCLQVSEEYQMAAAHAWCEAHGLPHVTAGTLREWERSDGIMREVIGGRAPLNILT